MGAGLEFGQFLLGVRLQPQVVTPGFRRGWRSRS
jgi:hypothetical protein